jgi:hypothetical protein
LGECVDGDCGGEGAAVVCWGVGTEGRVVRNSRNLKGGEVAVEWIVMSEDVPD